MGKLHRKSVSIDDLSDESLLRRRQVAEILGVTGKTLTNWSGSGLPVVKVSPRLNLYRWGSVRSWLRKREVAVVVP